MKKKILIAVVLIITLLIAAFIYAFIISFKVVKQTTDKINLAFKEEFQNIVRIPEPIIPSFKSLNKTSYTWDMVTNQEEVTKVSFAHDTGILNDQNKIIASLEMPVSQDPSLFVKVMPAVVSDPQALTSTQDLEHVNLGPNEKIGYNKIELFTSEKNPSQVTQIVWEFNKEDITNQKIKDLYTALNKYPQPVLKALYNIQRATLIILAP